MTKIRSMYLILLTALLTSITANASIIAVEGNVLTSVAAVEDFTFGSLSDPVTWVGTDITVIETGTDAGLFHTTGLNIALDFIDPGLLYQNSGTLGFLGISLTSGLDISALSFTSGNGFSSTVYNFLWISTYNDGLFTGFEFDFDLLSPSTISVYGLDGMVFDELRIASFGSAFNRDQHSFSYSSGASLNEIRVGAVASVPESGTLALISIGLLGVRLARRKKA